MRRSKADAAQTRQRIVETAATEFRRHGIHATGVAEVMAAAGLSHGGFYRHFDSKSVLVTEACETAMAAIVHTIEQSAAQGGTREDAFRAIVQAYLACPTAGEAAPECPFVGIGSELARTDAETRTAATRGFADMVEVIGEQVGGGDADAARSRAVFAVCAMIGAATVARIINDPDLAATVLEDVKAHLIPPDTRSRAPRRRTPKAST
jgi:TetR/AcrR family transcriptional regulator, transcriptional repressor for nem operon